ncbi:hypothetical protein [Vibrio sp. AND4]|uniref:hypothetical protein n=1 Tax=Vibrio sp. AND4 TaxID=314289 RepID=UPI00015F2F7A|nr:hypothetical protein [Vibrio sp. AND4]EDP60740.1 hypothetical protein AND4_07469 [Vibrio sp. AND4]
MNTNVIVRTSVFFTASIVLAELFNMRSVVLCIFLGHTLIGGHKFNFVKSGFYIIRILSSVVVGTLVGEIFYNNLFFTILISALLLWGLLYFIKYPSQIITYSVPVFLYCYALINTTSGFIMEDTIRELLFAVAYMIPLAWLCFKLFPSKHVDTGQVELKQESQISERHKQWIVALIICALTIFLAIEIGRALFCLSVAINVALRSSVKQGKLVIASIIPIQITGCLVGMFFNVLMLGHQNNIALFAVLLFLFTTVIIYFSLHEDLRHKDIPNFEVGFMSAVLVPVTLYTHSTGFNVEPFIERAFDMMCTWILLSVVMGITLYFKNKFSYNHEVISE